MKEVYSILIIDDEIQIVNSIARVLNSKRYRLEYTTTPEEAFEIILSYDFDIVLCDQRMPGTSGVEVLNFIKKYSPETVRILITGYSDIQSIIYAINESNIFKYISKPWSNENLINVIESAIEYKKEQRRKDKEYKEQLKRIEEERNQRISEERVKSLNSLIKVIKAKDIELFRHCEGVAKYALTIAEMLKLSEKQKESLKLAALLHDIGKIAIKDKVIYKPEKLNSEEFTEITVHPLIGAELVKEINGMDYVAQIICQHHEKVDGSGYPNGIKGNKILFELKILAVADTYDALVSDRVYRKGMSQKEAFEILIREKGKFYDSDIVDVFIGGDFSE